MKAMLATTHLGEDFTDRLQDTFPDVRFVSAFTPEEQLKEIADTDVYIGWPPREVFRAGKQLKWIHCVGTGVDHVEALQDIADAGVPLTNSLGPHAEPMGDHTMLFVLSLAHQAPKLWNDQKARRWETQAYAGQMRELNGSTMGIIGLGGIGRAVARRGLGFGMRVVAADPSPSEAPDGVEARGAHELDGLLRESDWLVVACPLTTDTRRLISHRELGLMKSDACVIVISRGSIVDEAALADAVRSGRLGGAALDALETEPLPDDSPLWGLPNVLISPHCSALTPEMYEGRRQIAIENMRRYLDGRPFLYQVDARAGF